MFKIKVIIIGEPGVGKTSLVKKFVSGYFSEDYKASIGTNIFTKKIMLNSNKEVLFQIWDIAGQERWLKMRNLYYRGSNGALVVGDLTRKNTFKQIIGFWIPDLKKNCTNIPFILIANKTDLKSNCSRIEIEEIGNNINANSILYTSAKYGEHVEDAFKLISKLALET
ncbi:MAG: Rab family GTPase [Candidatus Heimdallarchaeota archaeon]